ncbi:unnamed protein product, partial [marine sediment metagenome]
MSAQKLEVFNRKIVTLGNRRGIVAQEPPPMPTIKSYARLSDDDGRPRHKHRGIALRALKDLIPEPPDIAPGARDVKIRQPPDPKSPPRRLHERITGNPFGVDNEMEMQMP